MTQAKTTKSAAFGFGVSCASCRHFQTHADGFGDCCRYPPRIVGAMIEAHNKADLIAATAFPVVEDWFLCGEWAPLKPLTEEGIAA